jgi:hypothetical protein
VRKSRIKLASPSSRWKGDPDPAIADRSEYRQAAGAIAALMPPCGAVEHFVGTIRQHLFIASRAMRAALQGSNARMSALMQSAAPDLS